MSALAEVLTLVEQMPMRDACVVALAYPHPSPHLVIGAKHDPHGTER